MQIFRADALSNPLPIWKQNYCILLHFKHFAFTSNFLPPFLSPFFFPLLHPYRPSLAPPFLAATPIRGCPPTAQIW